MSTCITQHFIQPKNVGEISNAEAFGHAGSLTCGAVVTMSLRLDESQRITEAKFKAAGCSYLVAASSYLTEQIIGKTSGEAAALGQCREKAIIERFSDWPPDRANCVALACEALVSAIKNYSDAIRDEWAGDEALICTCFGVSERTIEQEIQAGNLGTIADVTRACNAGGGCRSCYSLIEDILEAVNRESLIVNRES